MAPEESGFTNVIEAHCPGAIVLTGQLEPGVRELICPEIEVAIPGERAAAEVIYQTGEGRQRQCCVTEKHVLIIPAGQPHRVVWRRASDVTVFLLSRGFAAEVARESGMTRFALIEDYSALDPVVWHLGREVRGELRRHRQLDSTYLKSVAIVLARHVVNTYASSHWSPGESNGLPRYKLRQATQFIQENLDRDITFHDVAAHLKISAYHFARMFRHSTGESPHQYIVRCRVSRAKELLAETRLPITEVAFEAGYKTQSHFTTSFGRLVGVSPAAFRAGK